MTDPITNRIIAQTGLPSLVEALSGQLSGADLHSLLLTVLRRRIEATENNYLSQPNPVSRPCDLDGRLLHRVEAIALDTVPQFSAVELSPLSPLGAVNRLTGLDQGNVLSTIRAFECASDPTIGLALHCAGLRRSSGSRKQRHNLCTSQRVVRFPLPQNPAYTAHFKLFSLVSAGRDEGSFSFESFALFEHIEKYLRLIERLNEESFELRNVSVEVSDTRLVEYLCGTAGVDRDEIRARVKVRDAASTAAILEKYAPGWPANPHLVLQDLAQYQVPAHLAAHLELLQNNVLLALGQKFPAVNFAFNLHRLTGLGYYRGPCFHIKAKNRHDQLFMLADGGFVDWTQVLLADKKERLMTSAIGLELLCRMFGKNSAD